MSGVYRYWFPTAEWAEIVRLAAERQARASARGTRDRRVDKHQSSVEINVLGVAGEWTARGLIGGSTFDIGNPRPDTGIDGTCWDGTIEVKASRHPDPAILVPNDGKGARADFLVACQIVPEQYGQITGWTDRATFLAGARREAWYRAGMALRVDKQNPPATFPDIGEPREINAPNPAAQLPASPAAGRCSRCKRPLSVVAVGDTCGQCKYWASPEYAARKAIQVRP